MRSLSRFKSIRTPGSLICTPISFNNRQWTTGLPQSRMLHLARTVIKRIRQNHLVAKERVDVRVRKIQQKVTNIRRGQLVERPGTKTPRVKNTLISANRVNRPLLQVKRNDIELKRTVILRAQNQGQAGRESQSVSRSVPRKPVKRQEVQRKDPQHARNDVQGVQPRQQRLSHHRKWGHRIKGSLER
jgi:hypothetical protein